MTIVQLKEKIENKSLSDDCLILKYSDDKYLCNHYIDEICKFKNLNKVYISSIDEALSDNSFFEMESDTLYVIDIEKFNEYPNNEYKNLVIMCKSLPDNLDIDYVEMPKVVNWQIEDYVKSRLSGLGEVEVQWLCQVAKYDISRLNQECKKLEIFAPGAQKDIFKIFNEDNAYSDLSPNNIFDFTDAIIKKNIVVIGNLVPEIDTADLEPLGVVTVLLKKFKQLASIQLSGTAPAGMSDKQFWYLKKNQCGIYSDKQLIKNIEFLSGIDGRIKSGNLELSREELLAYIIMNVLN